LNEGFELPFSVIKDIYEYYRDSYEKYRLKPRVKIEPKYFDLDFTGTRYAFLNDLNPRVLVELKGTLPAGYAGLYLNSQLKVKLDQNGWVVTVKIQLALSHFMGGPYIIEHELLHAVQELIRIKKGMKVIGGLPNMPLVKRVTDERGISIGGAKNVKRVKHGVRPIEYYTNLDTVIRMLQYRYVRMLLDSGKDMDLGVRDSEAKKEFFYRMKKENSWISNALDTVKFDEELYRIYLQEISKRFILNNNFGPDVMPMATDMGKFLAADRKSNEDAWQAAAERAGVSVAELKKRQEQRHKEMQEREREKAAKENEKKEQEKAEKNKLKEQEKAEKNKLAEEKRKKEKPNRERLVRQISLYADGGNYGSFRDFKPNFDKLVDFVEKNRLKLNGTNFGGTIYSGGGTIIDIIGAILKLIKFNHKNPRYSYDDNDDKKITVESGHEYDVESFYISFGRLKYAKFNFENNLKLKNVAKFFELFAEKLAEVFSDALELGSSGKKLILDNFYRNPVARAARYSR
jgi:hypothetical protein